MAVPYTTILRIVFNSVQEELATHERISNQLPDGANLECIQTGKDMFPVAYISHHNTFSRYQLIGDEPRDWQLGHCESSVPL